jgi:uncharacterized protein (TIGR02001 family)
MFPDRCRDIRFSPLATARVPPPLLPLLLPLLLSCAQPASGQTSAELTLVSEYTVRGVALGTRPAPQLRVDHDGDGGWYAGAFASPVTLDGHDQGQLMVYGGLARRIDSTLSWDAGFTRSLFSRDGWYDYGEFYAGLVLNHASARLFYAPNYYGAYRSVYLDLGNAWPLGERLRLTAHAGVFHVFDASFGPPNRVDTRLGLATEVGDFTLQLGWQAQWHAYVRGTARARALSASASLHF